MTEVRAIGRGLGYWGDMVIVLNDGSKMEMRSIDNWQEVKKYIDARIADGATIAYARSLRLAHSECSQHCEGGSMGSQGIEAVSSL